MHLWHYRVEKSEVILTLTRSQKLNSQIQGSVASWKLVGVSFSDHIKLLNGTQRCEGRIEVKHGDQWRKLCSSGWSQKEHEVMCQELKCGTPLVGEDMPDFGDRIAPIGVKASCLGNETSFMECEINETADTCDSPSLLCTSMLTLTCIVIGNVWWMRVPLGGCFYRVSWDGWLHPPRRAMLEEHGPSMVRALLFKGVSLTVGSPSRNQRVGFKWY